MAPKRTTRICREGFYYLVVLGFVVTGAVMREINLLLALAGMMAGPFLLNWRIAVDALRGVSVRRRLPARMGVGDLFVVDVLLEKNTPRSSVKWFSGRALTIDDTIVHEESSKAREQSHARAVAWKIGCGERLRVSYRGRFYRRGRYQFGPLRVSTRYPLGLVRRTLVNTASDSLIVLPQLGRLQAGWARLYRETVGASCQRLRQQVGREGEFHGLRDWQHGDMRRWIHWRATARRAAPIVRQFERPVSQEFVLLVDVASRHARANREDAAVEKLISFAATIVDETCRRSEGALHLAVGGATTTVIRGQTSSHFATRMLETLAVAQPSLTHDPTDLLARGLEGVKSGTPVVMLTTRPIDLGDAELLAEVGRDPQRRNLLERIHVVDVTSEEIDHYFRPADDVWSLGSQHGSQDVRTTDLTRA